MAIRNGKRLGLFLVGASFSLVAYADDVATEIVAQEGLALQGYFSVGFGGNGFKVGTATNKSTGEVKDVTIDPSAAVGIGARARYAVSEVIALEGGFGYNSATESPQVQDADVKFSWTEVSVSAIAMSEYVGKIRWHGGMGVDYLMSPEYSHTSAVDDAKGKYANTLGYHGFGGMEIKSSKTFSIVLDVYYRSATVKVDSFTYNGATLSNPITGSGKDMSQLKLDSVGISAGFNWLL